MFEWFNLPTFMFDFPSGGYLAFWVGIVLAVITAGVGLFTVNQRYILPALGLLAICVVLVVASLAVTNTEHQFEYAINNYPLQPLPMTPWWAMSLLMTLTVMLLLLVVKAIKEHTWMQAFAVGTLMFVAGAAFSQGGLFVFYADGWALANTCCWLATGATAIALIVNLARNFRAVTAILRPSSQTHPFVDVS